MSDRLGNLQHIWMFGSDTALPLLVAILTIDLLLTVLHSLQELNGQLWRYFGFIVGVKIPDRFGRRVFFVGLTLWLWLVGILGIGGAALWPTKAPGFLGFLIGCRVSDGIFSHIVPWLDKYRPNPGLGTVPLYFLEAIFLSWVFYPMLSGSFPWALAGFASGSVFFFGIIPLLRRFGPRLFKTGDKWLPGTPRPDSL